MMLVQTERLIVIHSVGKRSEIKECLNFTTREDSPYSDSFHFKDDYTSNNELN